MKREEERKAALRTFSTGRLNVPLCSPSPASFLQDACSLFCLPHRVSFSPGADAEEKTPSGLRESSIKERRPCPETNIQKFGAGSSSYSRLAINLKTSQLKKNASPPCRPPKTMPGEGRRPGEDRQLGKMPGRLSKKFRQRFEKKTAGKGPFSVTTTPLGYGAKIF